MQLSSWLHLVSSLPSLPIHSCHCFFIVQIIFNVGVFVICMLLLPYSPNCLVFLILWLFCKIMSRCLQSNFHIWSLQALSHREISTSYSNFYHPLNVLLTYFLWRLTTARIQLHYLLPSLLARISASCDVTSSGRLQHMVTILQYERSDNTWTH